MDRELFNKLPFEKQQKLENMCLRSILLELHVKEWEDDKRAYLSVRPMYRNPSGDELRYYTDNYQVVRTCGKHMFAALKFSGHVSSYGSSGFDVFYDDFYFSVNLERAQQMHNTLKWIERRVAEEVNELFEHGYSRTFTEYITAVVFAIGAVGGIVQDDMQERTQLDLDEFLEAVAKIEGDLLAKFAPVEETQVTQEELQPVPEAVSNNPRSEQDG